MRFKKLDLNLLVALDHMLALQSVSGAADKMFMSQSAMSNALTRLRTYFDDPLLVQVGKRMELTPRAEAMKPAIRDILVRVEATIDTQPEFDPTVSTRQFNVLVSDYTLRVLMPLAMAEMDKQGARVKLNLLAQSDTPFLMLERGDADFLITRKSSSRKTTPRRCCSRMNMLCWPVPKVRLPNGLLISRPTSIPPMWSWSRRIPMASPPRPIRSTGLACRGMSRSPHSRSRPCPICCPIQGASQPCTGIWLRSRCNPRTL